MVEGNGRRRGERRNKQKKEKRKKKEGEEERVGGAEEAVSLRITSSCATRGPEGGGSGPVMTDTMNPGVNEPNKC